MKKIFLKFHKLSIYNIKVYHEKIPSDVYRL